MQLSRNAIKPLRTAVLLRWASSSPSVKVLREQAHICIVSHCVHDPFLLERLLVHESQPARLM